MVLKPVAELCNFIVPDDGHTAREILFSLHVSHGADQVRNGFRYSALQQCRYATANRQRQCDQAQRDAKQAAMPLF